MLPAIQSSHVLVFARSLDVSAPQRRLAPLVPAARRGLHPLHLEQQGSHIESFRLLPAQMQLLDLHATFVTPASGRPNPQHLLWPAAADDSWAERPDLEQQSSQSPELAVLQKT